jgi:hypothetical protein
MPDFKTIADFRKKNGEAIGKVCSEFVVLCRRLELLSEASVAIDGSKFKAVNTRDRNFTQAKMKRRLPQIDESITRYLSQLDSADRQGKRYRSTKPSLRPCKHGSIGTRIRCLGSKSATGRLADLIRTPHPRELLSLELQILRAWRFQIDRELESSWLHNRQVWR